MRVEFHRIGEQHYSVVVLRENLPDLTKKPAPGFDPLMPHDMLHFLVERELGIERGIFGQIALGGTAGTFEPESSDQLDKRAKSRLRRKLAKREKTLSKQTPNDYAQSERATVICLYDWLAHSTDPELRSRAKEMHDTFKSVLGLLPKNERALLNKKKLAEIRKIMDDISQNWSSLQVNQFLTLDWSL